MKYPIYYATGAHHIKVNNNRSSLWVTDTRIEEHDYYDKNHIVESLKGLQSTEIEFQKAFIKTVTYLTKSAKK